MDRAELFNRCSRSPRKLLGSALPSGATIADVGCGTMWKTFLYAFLPRRDVHVVGVEKTDDSTIYGINAVPEYVRATGCFTLRGSDIEREPLPFDDASVDGVFLSHVIEHVEDRARLAREIARILKPGGYAYVETPGPRSTILPRHSRLYREGSPYPLNYLDDPSHLGEPMTLDALRGVLSDAGFEIRASGLHREFGRLFVPAYALAVLLGMLPFAFPGRLQLLGFGWWNLVGWPIYAFARKK
ncbi:MAG: class I SAM-dependent methyltransferase [bacterium]|nr:class I SAM-dependent methyltransferase [bacterium]